MNLILVDFNSYLFSQTLSLDTHLIRSLAIALNVETQMATTILGTVLPKDAHESFGKNWSQIQTETNLGKVGIDAF